MRSGVLPEQFLGTNIVRMKRPGLSAGAFLRLKGHSHLVLRAIQYILIHLRFDFLP
jgi:hypothetical protein